MTEKSATPQGKVVGIFTATKAGAPALARPEVRAVAGKGLEGDRYFNDLGTFSDGSRKSEITLIEVESIEALKQDYDIAFELGDSRRNIVTRGVPLNHLVSRSFRVGDALLEGVRLCEPCNYLEGLTQPGVRKALVHRGGLRARVVESGVVRVGDAVHLVGP